MKKVIYSSLLISTLGLWSCGEKFLDQVPYDSVNSDIAIQNENDMSNAVNGIYSGMRSSNLYGRTIPFVNDVMADNVYISTANSGRYLAQNTYGINSQDTYFTNLWASGYQVILRANNVVNANVTTTTNTDQYKGEALTTRAIMYFDLVRLFARPYTSDSTGMGVPIVLAYDPMAKPGRNTVAQTYAQIVSDLTQGFSLMTVTNKNSSYVSKYVAQAMLAKVYLYKGQYEKAKAAALDVVSKGGYSLADSASYVAYWNNPAPRTDKLETIFEISADNVNNAGSDALANMYSQAGYGDGLAATDLYNLYSDRDVRKKLIIAGKRSGNDALIVNKYQNVSNNNDKDDFKIIRYADVLLILAESYYRTGDETNALKYLNMVAQKREPSLKAYTFTGAALLDAIITERRKELAFEGDRFDDLNRLGRDITRSTQYPSAAQNIPFTDYRRVAPIPQDELNANAVIRSQQNPGY
ncbi:RagB/SusD family nutrient uptake outer membrane protein [Spirosoma sp. SC4-14]|uniref:RagB/SusD family nutrient uptake outer membrane protein n=1 Tax=Spirosoma sp. SC4-14 TaxID=3128900 RepID=UPI0030D5761F